MFQLLIIDVTTVLLKNFSAHLSLVHQFTIVNLIIMLMSFTVKQKCTFKSFKKGLNGEVPIVFQKAREKCQLFVRKQIKIKETKWKFLIYQSRDIYHWSIELLQVSSKGDPNWELGEQADRCHLDQPSIFSLTKKLKIHFFK